MSFINLQIIYFTTGVFSEVVTLLYEPAIRPSIFHIEYFKNFQSLSMKSNRYQFSINQVNQSISQSRLTVILLKLF